MKILVQEFKDGSKFYVEVIGVLEEPNKTLALNIRTLKDWAEYIMPKYFILKDTKG